LQRDFEERAEALGAACAGRSVESAITDPKRNPFTDLSVQGQGRAARYKFIK
jgi:hypothetical protein